MKKSRKKTKKIVPVVAVMVSATLLGTSYAYWSKATPIETQVATGDIDAVGQHNTSARYRLCANIHCDILDGKEGNGHYHNALSGTIHVQSKGSVPIKVTGVKITQVTFNVPKWRKKTLADFDNDQINAAKWRLAWDWNFHPTDEEILEEILAHYSGSAYKHDGTQEYTVDTTGNPNIDSKIAVKSQTRNADNSVDVVLDYGSAYGNFREKFKSMIRASSAYTNYNQTYNNIYQGNEMALIDVNYCAKLTMEVTYTQFNGTGWTDTCQLVDANGNSQVIEIEWNRLMRTWWSWENITFPNNWGYAEEAKNIPPDKFADYQ